MIDFFEQMGLTIVIALLAKLKRDPSHVPVFKSVLEHIVTDSCYLLGVTPPAFT